VLKAFDEYFREMPPPYALVLENTLENAIIGSTLNCACIDFDLALFSYLRGSYAGTVLRRDEEMKEDWKFSQSKLLKNAAFDVREGICLSISYEWCKRKLANLPTGETQMAKSYPSMSQQRAFTDFKQSGKNTQQWIAMLSKGDSMQSSLVSNGNWAGGSYAGCGNAIDRLDSGVYLFIATGNTVAHAMALAVTNAGKIFFDSNAGQYSVDAGKIGTDIEGYLAANYAAGVVFSPGYWRFFQLTGHPTHVGA
jgi:hypothetical protein